MTTLYWDIETRSTVDLRKAGVYVYAEHPDTEVILAAWAFDDDPVSWARTHCITEHTRLWQALADPSVRVVAHNAGFERQLLTHVLAKRHGWPVPSLDRWDCTAARAARLALPRSLDGAAAVLGLAHQKDKVGHALMMRMCKPRKVEDGTITWWEDNERMARLGAYCAVDVEVERELDRILPRFDADERAIWELTEKINDRGVPVDIGYVTQAQCLVEETHVLLDERMRAVTSGFVPRASNVPQLREWMRVNHTNAVSLDKAAVNELLKNPHLYPYVRKALTIRQEAGKTSVKKFTAIADRSSEDCRVRGNLVYHGASPGRWAGAGVQMQNMPRNVVKDFEAVEKDVWGLSAEEFADKYGSTLNTLTGTLRGTIVAPKGKKFVWADYAAVEARGVAWLAGANKLTQRFREDGAIYEEMAASIYGVLVREIGNPSTERFVGKTVILGCGYGMGVDKFEATCAAQGVILDPGIASIAVGTYRNEHHQIPALWRGLENAALRAVRSPGMVQSYRAIKFKSEDGWLRMRLPNGRHLWYRNPRVTDGKYGDVLEYDALNALTKQWGPETTWGGKLTENAVQGLCRDLMAHAMLRLEACDYPCILSVHDEVICEVPDDTRWGRDAMVGLMTIVPEWAEGFPLKAEGKEGYRYGK